MLAGLQSCEDLTRERGSTSKGAHAHGWQMNAGFWQEDSVPHHVGLSTGLLEDPDDRVAGLPPGPVMQERAKQESQVTGHHCCSILLVTQVGSIQHGRGPHRV